MEGLGLSDGESDSEILGLKDSLMEGLMLADGETLGEMLSLIEGE